MQAPIEVEGAAPMAEEQPSAPGFFNEDEQDLAALELSGLLSGARGALLSILAEAAEAAVRPTAAGIAANGRGGLVRARWVVEARLVRVVRARQRARATWHVDEGRDTRRLDRLVTRVVVRVKP